MRRNCFVVNRLGDFDKPVFGKIRVMEVTPENQGSNHGENNQNGPGGRRRGSPSAAQRVKIQPDEQRQQETDGSLDRVATPGGRGPSQYQRLGRGLRQFSARYPAKIERQTKSARAMSKMTMRAWRMNRAVSW